jgi:SNF2 family DNA or RNA helicase
MATLQKMAKKFYHMSTEDYERLLEEEPGLATSDNQVESGGGETDLPGSSAGSTTNIDDGEDEDFKDESDDALSLSSSKPKKTKATSRKRKQTSFEDDVEKSRPKTKAGKSKKQKQDKPQKDTSRKAKADNPRKVKAGRKAKELVNNPKVSTLLGTDVFADQQRNANVPDAPAFTDERERRTALQALVNASQDKPQARIDRNLLDLAITRLTGSGVLKPEDGGWRLKGMRTRLHNFQVTGVAFMRQRETMSDGQSGGLLCDQMGLGKTVMVLANILNGRPHGRRNPKTTLIIAPRSLLTQWSSELPKHCKGKYLDKDDPESRTHGYGHVNDHFSGHRLSGTEAQIMAKIRASHIVFTTYSEISSSFPKADAPIECTTSEAKREWWDKHYEESKGMWHRIKFHRIVLDEAQTCKNHLSRVSMACRELEAEHRWAISGTPAMNTVQELYPYFRFLRLPAAESFEMFKRNYCSPDESGNSKLTGLLSVYMIRRTHADSMFSSRLLTLPQARARVMKVEFSEVERMIYETIKTRFISQVNAVMQSDEDSPKKSYNTIWVLLLRLRMCTSHILLIQDCIIDLFQLEDYEKLNRIIASNKKAGLDDSRLLRQIARALSEASLGQTEEEGGSGMQEIIQQPLSHVRREGPEEDFDAGGRHGLVASFSDYISKVRRSEKWQEIEDATICSSCHQHPQEPRITSCFHIYCEGCLTHLQHHAARHGLDAAMCVVCGTKFTSVKECMKSLPEENRESAEDTQGNSTRKKRIPSWISTMPGEIISSAKTRAIKCQIMEWLREDPTGKIIVRFRSTSLYLEHTAN